MGAGQPVFSYLPLRPNPRIHVKILLKNHVARGTAMPTIKTQPNGATPVTRPVSPMTNNNSPMEDKAVMIAEKIPLNNEVKAVTNASKFIPPFYYFYL